MTKEKLMEMGMSAEVAEVCLVAFQNELGKESRSEKSQSVDVSQFEKQIADLKQALKDKNVAHEKAVHEMKLDTAIEKALTGANVLHQKAVRPFLEGLDKAEFADDGTVKGLADQLKSLSENAETSFLFKATEPPKVEQPSPTITGAKVGEGQPSIGEPKLDLAKMGYTAYNEAMQKMGEM